MHLCRIDRYTAASDPTRKLSMSNLKPQHPLSNTHTAPGSPAASMQTNPSATNPLHHSENFHKGSGPSFSQLPGPAAHHSYLPNAQAARLSQTPSVVSMSGLQPKHRSSSMVAHTPANGPAPTSIPPEIASHNPPIHTSSLDASEPRLFPGIVSKSRKGSMVTTRSGVDVAEENVPDHMTQSLPAIAFGRASHDDDEAIVEDEVGETE